MGLMSEVHFSIGPYLVGVGDSGGGLAEWSCTTIRSIEDKETVKQMQKYDFEKLNVLLIEDEMFVRTIVRRLLMQIGFREVQECSDGMDALSKLMNWSPDIIVSDIHMEPMNGVSFLKNVRKMDRLKHIPIVFLTSEKSADIVREAQQLGISGYVVKPVSLAALEKRVSLALERNIH